MATLRDQLVQVLVDDLKLDPVRITPDAHLIADLGFDSMAFTLVVGSLENAFSIRLSDEKALACITFADMETLVTDAIAEGAAA